MYLVHVFSRFPEGKHLVAGGGTWNGMSAAEIKSQGLPFCAGRYTLHFALGHVVAPHSGRANSEDCMALLIDIEKLSQDVLSKFFGNPEDLVLFGDGLDLTELDATIIMPESRVKEYRASTINKLFGSKINVCCFSSSVSLQICVDAFAKRSRKEICTPHEYVDSKDTESPVVSYKIGSGDQFEILLAQDIMKKYFANGPDLFCFHSTI